jgi:hypothetical protein
MVTRALIRQRRWLVAHVTDMPPGSISTAVMCSSYHSFRNFGICRYNRFSQFFKISHQEGRCYVFTRLSDFEASPLSNGGFRRFVCVVGVQSWCDKTANWSLTKFTRKRRMKQFGRLRLSHSTLRKAWVAAGTPWHNRARLDKEACPV